jgi:hypothetical protein
LLVARVAVALGCDEHDAQFLLAAKRDQLYPKGLAARADIENLERAVLIERAEAVLKEDRDNLLAAAAPVASIDWEHLSKTKTEHLAGALATYYEIAASSDKRR